MQYFVFVVLVCLIHLSAYSMEGDLGIFSQFYSYAQKNKQIETTTEKTTYRQLEGCFVQQRAKGNSVQMERFMVGAGVEFNSWYIDRTNGAAVLKGTADDNLKTGEGDYVLYRISDKDASSLDLTILRSFFQKILHCKGGIQKPLVFLFDQGWQLPTDPERIEEFEKIWLEVRKQKGLSLGKKREILSSEQVGSARAREGFYQKIAYICGTVLFFSVVLNLYFFYRYTHN